MSMGTIGKAMKATRTQMIESESDQIASEFYNHFRMRDGSYIRYRKTGGHWKQARIMHVDECYFNNAGGYTSAITVAPLLVNGKLGKTRSLLLAVSSDGGNLHGVHYCNDVQRIPAIKEQESTEQTTDRTG